MGNFILRCLRVEGEGGLVSNHKPVWVHIKCILNVLSITSKYGR